ncbi:MAG: glycoside hydrolase family 16, partial [Actinomycetota bacterium]|nr:glycoside hydrolase family 16 [Actinomycetota bacterium]
MPFQSDRPDPATVVDDFEGEHLNRTRWLPAYLPAWSSVRAAAASWTVRDSLLRLTIPPDHPIWCEGDHRPPLRVSAVQSGNYSGPVGSSLGQQPYREGLRVQEEQAPFWG